MDTFICTEYDDDDDDIPLIELIKRQKPKSDCETAYNNDFVTPSNSVNDKSESHVEDTIFEENSFQNTLNDITVFIEEETDFNSNLYNESLVLSMSDIPEVSFNSDFSFSLDTSTPENSYISSPIEVEVAQELEITTLHENNEKENTPSVSINLHSYAKGSENENYRADRQSRKRKRDPTGWKQNRRKRRRENGEDYINKAGKRIPMRISAEANCKCKFKCKTKITKNDREQVFCKYWKLNYDDKRLFIRKQVLKIEKKRKTLKENSRRNKTLEYYLPTGDINTQVCKAFFLTALCIKERTVMYNLKDDIGNSDKRGKSRNFKIKEEAKNIIREHIRSYPTVASHYCRATSQRKYLDKELSVKQMYREYCQMCNIKNIGAEKWWLYNEIFNNDFNLGFHRPKKDLCSFCESFRRLDPKSQEEKINEYNMHQKRKSEARQQKENDKSIASESKGKTKLINFDLQKVLQCPKTEIGEMYYSRKFATYNFTVFDVVSRKADCYMWHECTAKRGSCEISSCIYDYNKSLGEIDHLIYYSDSCTGQQRNLQFSTMCLYSVVNLPIDKITHNYFERGHSQMEGDAVHATIERHTKRQDIFTPEGWMHSVRNSKHSTPKYKVKEVLQKDIFDFKMLASDTVCNRSIATDGTTVKWNKIHSFQYRKSEPNIIFFKYELNSEWNMFNISSKKRRNTGLKSICRYQLSGLYTSPLPISEKKYKDLEKLCKTNIIPAEYHAFYRALPHGDVVSRLPEPNESDISDTES